MNKSSYYSIIFVFVIFLLPLVSCTVSKIDLKKTYTRMKHKIVNLLPRKKVTRNGLKWDDGAYFPQYVYEYFPRIKTFRKLYPTLESAKEGIKLIDIKMLNNSSKKYHEANLSWTNDGSHLSYEILTPHHRKIMLKSLLGEYTKELLVMVRNDQNDIFTELFEPPSSYNSYLSWSGDGKFFTFMSNGGRGDYDIYVGGLNYDESKITHNSTKDGYANWNKIDNSIVFVSGRTGNGDLYLTDPAGSFKRQLTSSDNNDLFPIWSPNGKYIVYTSGTSNNHDIYILHKFNNLTRSFKLTALDSDDIRPTVSPDGTKVAFYSNFYDRKEDKWAIMAVDISRIPWEDNLPDVLELEPTLIAKDVVVDLNTGPSWTPDSKKIIFVKRNTELFNPIFIVDLTNGLTYHLPTGTKMNHDIMCSNSGIISFRAQVNSWDRVFVALTNQSIMLQTE